MLFHRYVYDLFKTEKCLIVQYKIKPLYLFDFLKMHDFRQQFCVS